MTILELRAWPLAGALMLMLAACNADRPAEPIDEVAREALEQPAQDVPPATAPVTNEDPPHQGDARWDGYAAARFGMNAEELRRSWAGTLAGIPGEGTTCFHLYPEGQAAPAEFALMLEGDKFVRYSVESPDFIAPGGGRVGMDAPRIESLYPGLQRQPHKYTDGQYLRVSGDQGGVLVFETGEDGVVDEWRVGLPPQVDYVEGCS